MGGFVFTAGAVSQADSSILGDVSIGDVARIGDGPVVASDVPDGCTAVWVPARLTNYPEKVS